MRLTIPAILRLFYALQFVWMGQLHTTMFERIPPPLPVELLAWISPQVFYYFSPLLLGGTLLAIFVCAIYPWSRVWRLLAFLGILFSLAWINSKGRMIHSYHGSLYVALALVFLPDVKKTLSADMAQSLLEKHFVILQLSLVLCYFPAGLWKVRDAFSAFAGEGMDGIVYTLNNAIAAEHLLTGFPLSRVVEFYLDHPYISAASYIAVMLLQLSSPLFVFAKKWNWVFALFIVIFYVMSIVLLGIPFHAQTILVVLFFFLSPFSYRSGFSTLVHSRKSLFNRETKN